MKNLKITRKCLSLLLCGSLVFMSSGITENSLKKFEDSDVTNIEPYSNYETNLDNYIPYTLNIADYSSLSDSEYEVFKYIVDRLLNHEDVIVNNTGLNDNDFVKVTRTIRDSEFWSIIKEMSYYPATKELKVIYRYSKEKCISVLNSIHEYMQNIIDEIIEPDMNDLDKVLVLYRYVLRNYFYDYVYQYKSKVRSSLNPSKWVELYSSLYDVQETNLGVCHTFSYFMSYAANMLGIKMSTVRGYCKEGYHMWLIAEIDGYNYYFDPTYEIATGKYGLRYFGMTMEERNIDNARNYIPDNYAYDMELIHEPTFQNLRNVTKYEYLGNHIFEMNSGKKVSYYNTETKELTNDKPEIVMIK